MNYIIQAIIVISCCVGILYVVRNYLNKEVSSKHFYKTKARQLEKMLADEIAFYKSELKEAKKREDEWKKINNQLAKKVNDQKSEISNLLTPYKEIKNERKK